MENIIKETVDFGSVYLALEYKLFTHKQLLNWLVLAPLDSKTLIAYKAVTDEIPLNQQYHFDSSHFLTRNKNYATIARRLGFTKKITCHKDGDELLVDFLKDHFITETNSNDYEHKVHECNITVNPEKEIFKTIDTIQRGYFVRKFIWDSSLTSKTCNTLLVKADWTDKFRYKDDLITIIMRRMSFLFTTAPTYYEKVALPAYTKVIIRLNNEHLLNKLSFDDLLLFDKFFPNILHKSIFSLDKSIFSIGLMSFELAGYLLGFPIHTTIPDQEQIFKALNIIQETSITEYIQLIKDYNRTLPINLSFLTNKPKFCNNEDVLLEDVARYSPFDIVLFQTGDHIHRFTRPEFKQILESGKNHWTNDWLPIPILGTIQGRKTSSDAFGLPPSRTMEEMFERLEKGILFEEDKDETPELEWPQQQPIVLSSDYRIRLNNIVGTVGGMLNIVNEMSALTNQEIRRMVSINNHTDRPDEIEQNTLPIGLFMSISNEQTNTRPLNFRDISSDRNNRFISSFEHISQSTSDDEDNSEIDYPD